MRHLMLAALASLLVAFLVGGCSWSESGQALKGSGTVVDESRAVRDPGQAPSKEGAIRREPVAPDDGARIEAVAASLGTGCVDVVTRDGPADQSGPRDAVDPVRARTFRFGLGGVRGDDLQTGPWPKGEEPVVGALTDVLSPPAARTPRRCSMASTAASSSGAA